MQFLVLNVVAQTGIYVFPFAATHELLKDLPDDGLDLIDHAPEDCIVCTPAPATSKKSTGFLSSLGMVLELEH
jgi:hypothetical protein